MIEYSTHRTHTRNLKRGFTIVETLIAITILMIAIAGPLVVATKGLTSAAVSKNQMIASYLAQESMEVIKSVRYNNDVGTTAWLTGFQDCRQEIGNFCDAASISDNDPAPSFNLTCSSGTPRGCEIYYDTDTGYNHLDEGYKTAFRRYFQLENNDTPGEADEKIVHVYVEWEEGRVPYQIHLTSQLINVRR
jgi:type II secretory pathway pseudopilin PulG